MPSFNLRKNEEKRSVESYDLQNEYTDDQMERMVKAKDTNVYLETMEVIKNKDKEPDETWYA